MKMALVLGNTPEALLAKVQLEKEYIFTTEDEADVWVVLGGDGTMLETLHKAKGTTKKVFGMNCGTVGFLMNHFDAKGLEQRLEKTVEYPLSPLVMVAQTQTGETLQNYAFNEVSLLRQTGQVADISISVDGKERLGSLVCDGVMVSTPAGSTAYNTSVGGPILPLGSPLIALTSISAFRPRRWRGALLPQKSEITFFVNNPEKRPVNAAADFIQVPQITFVTVRQATDMQALALFDQEHHLEERILLEQFSS